MMLLFSNNDHKQLDKWKGSYKVIIQLGKITDEVYMHKM